MENDPPGVETMPLTSAQEAARAKRVRGGLAALRKERALTTFGTSSAAESCGPAPAASVSDIAARARETIPHVTVSLSQQKQIEAVALAAAMKRHGVAFRLRVQSQKEWDATVALRMRSDNCDRPTALDREHFVSPLINVRG